MTEGASLQRFPALDALRGVAAFAVLFYHMRTLEGAPASLRAAFGSGYLAVDLFFLMSGFVIAHAYETRLSGHMTFRTFMKARFVRLQPVIAVGTLMGLAVCLYQRLLGLEGAPGLFEICTALPANLLLLPNVLVPWGIFLFNPPAWSLFYELLASAIYAACLRFSRAWSAPVPTFAFTALLCAIALALALAVLSFGSLDHGIVLQDWPIASARIGFSFIAGLLLHRTKLMWVRRLPSIHAGWLMTACILFLLPSFTGLSRIAYDLLFTLSISPSLVMLAVASSPSPRSQSIANWLGLLSYPLYALHAPIKHAFEAANMNLGVLLLPSAVTVSVGLGWLVVLVDPVLRTWLSRQLDRLEKPFLVQTFALTRSR